MTKRSWAAWRQIQQVAAVCIRRTRRVKHDAAHYVRIVGKEAVKTLGLAKLNVVVAVRAAGLQNLQRFRITVLNFIRAQLISTARSDGRDRRLTAAPIEPTELFLMKCIVMRRAVAGSAHRVEAVAVIAEVSAAAHHLSSAINGVGMVETEIVTHLVREDVHSDVVLPVDPYVAATNRGQAPPGAAAGVARHQIDVVRVTR